MEKMTKMGMFDSCKMAHEAKDMLKEKMEHGMVNKSIEVSDRDLLMFIALNSMCSDDVMEATRKHAYMPANAKIAEADGIYTIHLDDKAGFAKAIKDQGKDLDNAVHHALEMVEEMRMIDPVRYNQFMAKLK